MRFRRALDITVGQFSSVFKLLLYRLATGVVFFSLSYVIIRYGLVQIVESAEIASLQTLAQEYLHALVTANAGALEALPLQFSDALKAFFRLLGGNIGSIAGAVVGIALLYVLGRYFNGLALYALGGGVHDRMSAYSRTSFASTYFRTLGQASLYQLVYVPLAFVYDVLSLLACALLFFYIPSLLMNWSVLSVLLSLSLSLALVLCLQALKLTVASSWMPAMVADGMKVGAALKDTRTHGKSFLRRYGGFLAACYGIAVFNVVCALATLGSALLLTVPMSYLFLIAMQFVNYYGDKGRKFFLSDGTVAGETQPADLDINRERG